MGNLCLSIFFPKIYVIIKLSKGRYSIRKEENTMIHIKYFEKQDKNAKEIMEKHINSMISMLMEKELLEYSVNFLIPLGKIPEHPEFGAWIRYHFLKNSVMHNRQDLEIGQLYVKIYQDIKNEKIIEFTASQKQLLLGYLLTKQNQLREAKIIYYDKDSVIFDKDDAVCMFDIGTDILYYKKKIYPAIDRKYIYDAFQKKYPKLTTEELLKCVRKFEKFSNIYLATKEGIT